MSGFLSGSKRRGRGPDRGKSKSQSLAQMTPEQIRERGRELLRLAHQKETEIRQRQLLQIGEIFQREIQGGWPATWEQLSVELESIIGCKIDPPQWGVAAGVQGGGSAPLVTGEGGEDEE